MVLILKLIGGLLAIGAALGLAGCDPFAIHKIKVGQTTQTQVLSSLGKPTMIWDDGKTGLTLEYSGQPQGSTNYMIDIGADGIVSDVRQVLTPEYFALIQPAMTLEQVRKVLGKPAKEVWYSLKQEKEVDWRFQATPTETKIFTVVVNDAGIVLRSYEGPDIERSDMYRGGR